MVEGNPQSGGSGGQAPAQNQYTNQQTQNPGQAPRQAPQAAPAPVIDQATQATLTAADNMEKQRDYQGAANLLQQSLGNNLQNPLIHHQLAVDLLNLGQLEEAVSEFRIASALSPSNKMFMEDYARALKIHKKALMDDAGSSAKTTGAVGDLK